MKVLRQTNHHSAVSYVAAKMKRLAGPNTVDGPYDVDRINLAERCREDSGWFRGLRRPSRTDLLGGN